MSAQGGRQDLGEQARSGMHQREKVGHRETASWLLFSRLTKVLLQGWRVGHRETRTIDIE